jgi:filamentous hemagglutinin family protein
MPDSFLAPSQMSSEPDRRHGLALGGLCLCGIALVAPLPAVAGPTDGRVRAGDASITSGRGEWRIEQRSTRAIIDWQRFDVAQGERVVFSQPAPDAVALNRVVNATPGFSTIDGSLTANGRVILVNPYGVLFGPDARVNVASLIATTADISNADFMDGTGTFHGAGRVGAGILNQGQIAAAPGGFVALLGARVENRGSITAEGGTVVLGGGDVFTVDVTADGLIKVALGRVQRFGPPPLPVARMGDVRVGDGMVLMRRADAAQLTGTLNAVPVEQVADSATLLEGGAVLLVGPPSGARVAEARATNEDPGRPSGGGVVDVSPMYSLGFAARVVPPPSGPVPQPHSGLTAFNRLRDQTPPWSLGVPDRMSGWGSVPRGAIQSTQATTEGEANAVQASTSTTIELTSGTRCALEDVPDRAGGAPRCAGR